MSALQAEIEAVVAAAVLPLHQELVEIRKTLEGEKPLLTTKQKAAQLGIKPDTLRRKVRGGEMTCVRVGNQMRFES